MDEEVWKAVKMIMEKIRPFIALAILIFIVLSTIQLIKYNELQQQIKTSCGYQKSEDVYCVCDRGIVSDIYTPDNPYYKPLKDSNLSTIKDGD